MRRSIVPLAAAIVLAAACSAPEPPSSDTPGPVDRIVDAALAGDEAWSKLAYLTDRIGPRLAGSANLDRAIAWAADAMRADGADEVRLEPVSVPHWVRGEETGRIVSPVEHPLVLLALGMSVGTPPSGLTAEVVEVTSLEEVERIADRVRGRVVLYNRQMGGDSLGGYGDVVPMRYRGASVAARHGAVAMLVRSLGTADFRLPHTGAQAYEEGVPQIPAAAITAEDADLIHRLLEAGDPVVVHYTLGCRLLPEEAESANVVAEIRGRELPDEIVVVGAHLDSWDVGTGAIDDGAGSVAVMETVRLIRSLDLRPRRTIRAVLFTNEENGLRGGRDYASRHAGEMDRHVAAMEADAGGGRATGFGVTAGPGAVEPVRLLAAPLDRIGASDVGEGGGGADIGPMRDAGVPQVGLRQDTSRYFHYHHTMADTLDKVDRDDLAQTVAAFAGMAWALADAPEPLPRYVPSPSE